MIRHGIALDARAVPLAFGAALCAIAAGWAAAHAPLATLVVLLVATLLVMAVVVPQYLLLVLVAAMPWENQLEYPSAALSVVKLLGLLLFAGWCVRTVARNDRIETRRTTAFVAVFVLAAGVSLVVSPDPEAGLLKTARYVLFATLFFLMLQLVRDLADVRRVIRVLLLFTALSAVYALYLFIAMEWVDRAAGPMHDPNDYAQLLGAVLPLGAYIAVVDRRWRPLWLVCLALILAALLATFSRGAVLGLGVVVLWAVAMQRVSPGTVLVSGILLVAVMAAGFKMWAPIIEDSFARKQSIAADNVDSRGVYWAAALRLSAERPLTGVGPGRFGTAAKPYVQASPIYIPDPVVHNSYLEILVESGIVALGAFLAYILGTWRLLTHALRRVRSRGDPLDRWLVTAMQAAWIFILVTAFFLSSQVTTSFWLFGALAAVTAACMLRSADDAPAKADSETLALR